MKNHGKTFAELRGGLLGAVGVSALMIGSAMAVPGYDGGCTLVGATVSCEGAEAEGGVNIGDLGISQLNISLLTADIVPPAGSPGVVLDTSSAAAVEIINTGHTIRTSGAGADGVYVSSWAKPGEEEGTFEGGGDASLLLDSSVDSSGARGVVVVGFGAATSDTTGDIAALGQALTVKGEGGAVTVDHTGKLTSLEGGGLIVEAMGGSDIEVHGDIDSLGNAVESHSYDSGNTSVVLEGKVTAREGSGIVVREDSGTATLDVTGDIAASVDGINVTAHGDIGIEQKGTLTTDSGTGIYANSSTGGVEITRNAAALSAHGDAIVAEAHGADGHVTIASPGSVNSDAGRGVVASAANGTVDITLGSSTTAKLDAIWAEAMGDGAYGVDIESHGDIVSYDGGGIYAYSTGRGFEADAQRYGVRIEQSGNITSKLDAVTAIATNSNVLVDVAGSIESYDGHGVHAESANGNVDISTDGITSGLDALYALANNGDVTVNVGTVTSYGGDGVHAHSDRGAVDITVDGSITTEFDAIYAQANDGLVSVEAGDVRSYKGSGIYAQSDNGAVGVSAGSVTSEGDAVSALAENGNVTVTVTGGVSSNTGAGVLADSGNGNVRVEVGGNVDAGGKGIEAKADAGKVDVLISGHVAATGAAVTAVAGTGPVTIDIDGSVDSFAGGGIYATSPIGPVTIDAGAITSELDAVHAQSDGGAVDIEVGDVTSYKGKGVYAQSDSARVDVTTGDITSELDAVYAQSNGGAVTVEAGDVLSNKGKGILAQSDSGAVTITADSLTSELDGIHAQSDAGPVSIGVEGSVVSYKGRAIQGLSDSGNVGIDVGGDVEAGGEGIHAISKNGRIDVTVDGDLTAKLDGIYATADSGSIDIALGDVTSYDGRGIYALTDNGTVTVKAGELVSQLDGIYVESRDSALDIDLDGGLTSYGGVGIHALTAYGNVSVDVAGRIETQGDAIVTGSTGGADSSTIEIATGDDVVSYAGRGIVADSSLGTVTIDSTGALTAELDGIVARSTGEGPTGAVTVTQTGALTSWKGKGIDASSARGAVTVVTKAGVSAELDAIVAQGEGDGDVSVTASGGDIISYKGTGITAASALGAVAVTVAQGGSVSGSSGGVRLDAGTTATLTNHGDIASSGRAVDFRGAGTGTVDNYGTISGDFAFEGGTGTFNNYLGATYNAGTAMTFAGGGTFYNAGTLSLSDGTTQSGVQTTTLTGNLSQSTTGRLQVDVHLGDDKADLLAVSGTASLAGALALNLTGDIDAGVLGSFGFISADGGLTLDGISISNPTLYGAITAENGVDGVVRISGIDFNPTGIDPSVMRVGAYVQSIFSVGVPAELKPLLLALANTEDLPTYEAALDQLSPDAYSQDIQNSYGSNLSFANRLLSCRVADGPNRFKAEGDCDWFGVRGSVLEQDGTDELTASRQTLTTFEAGSQRRIDDTWRLGGGVGLTSAYTSAADGSESRATQGHAGVVVKYDSDALLLASALTAGYGVHETERHVTIGTFDDTLTGEAAIAYLSARLHGAYTIDLGTAYIKPLFNLDLTATHFGGVTETGGGTALTVDAGTQYSATFNPAIEVGGEIRDSNGNLIRPYVQVGLEASLTSDLQVAARFAGVDPSIGSFTIGQPDAEPVARLSAGADILTEDAATIRVYYDGAFGATSRRNGLGMKLSNTFD